MTRTKLAPSFWQVIDANYHTQLEARYALQTDDGVVIAVINRGVRRGSDECVERFHMMLEQS